MTAEQDFSSVDKSLPILIKGGESTEIDHDPAQRFNEIKEEIRRRSESEQRVDRYYLSDRDYDEYHSEPPFPDFTPSGYSEFTIASFAQPIETDDYRALRIKVEEQWNKSPEQKENELNAKTLAEIERRKPHLVEETVIFDAKSQVA